MSNPHLDRDANALRILAAAQTAQTELAVLRPLIDYLQSSDDEQIRADALAAADDLSLLAERMRSLFGERDVPDFSEERAESQQQIEALQLELERRSTEITELRSALEVAQAESSDERRTLTAERDAVREQLKSASERVDELSKSEEALKAENHKLQAKSDSYASALRERSDAPLEAIVDDEPLDAEMTIEGVIEIARDDFDRVIIPEAAPKDIESLEADEKSADWAREILRGLKALQAYAEDSQMFTGGFWEWCEHSNNPATWNASPQKLAMRESDTVRNDSRLWKMRRFLIDSKVSPNGYQHMEAHLKISEGGGQHIPRLYFHDDTKGRTGNVHVGLIGPHRLVPTGQS